MRPGYLMLMCSFLAGSCLAAEPAVDRSGPYVGVFGGWGAALGTSLRQQGGVYLNPPHERPVLPIDADGATGSSTRVGAAGLHFGYEWTPWTLGSGWGMRPAAEIEGLYIGKHTPLGNMPVKPSVLGTQYVSIPLTAKALLANVTLTFDTPYSRRVFPYLGLGAGVASVSIKGSDSANPSEPGINHFNSDPDARDSAFALQFKAGLKGEISKNVVLFAEYRHLRINATQYTFGATDYPGLHLPTREWDVNLGRQKYNLFMAGLQYRF